MRKKVDFFAFEKISSDMAKEFGAIRKGYEEDYALSLFPIEGNLLKASRNSRNNNGRKAAEAVKVSLFIIKGYIQQEEYDLDKYITDENKGFIHAVLMAVDPFTNETLSAALQNIYDLESADDLRKYFTLQIKCLLRIEKSIEFWTQNMGATGYFDFLEDQIGLTVAKDNIMDFTVELPKE